MKRKTEDFVVGLYRLGLVRTNVKTAHTGETPIYFNQRDLVATPKLLKRATKLVYKKLKHCGSFERISGVPMGGHNLAVATAARFEEAASYYKPPKGQGTGEPMVGLWHQCQETVIIEDTMSSGVTTEKYGNLIRPFCTVKHVIILIDREMGGRDLLESKGYTVHVVLTLRQCLKVFVKHGLMTRSDRRRILHEVYGN